MNQEEAVKKIGAEVGITNLWDKILSIGKKRTEILDEAGVASKQAVVKTEGGFEYPMRCYAYVPDNEQVSTWKLRLCAPDSTEITREQLGAAAAAFSPGGFRGQRVELPREAIAKVKLRIRQEYEKLGIDEADMPESIKSLEATVDGLKEKFVKASKACATDMRKKMDAMLTEYEKEDADKVVMLRQLAELVAQIDNEELRNQLTEIVMAMQAEYAPEEEEAIDVEEIAKALQLDKLSDLLELQTKELTELREGQKAVEALVSAIEELVSKYKEMSEAVSGLVEKVHGLEVTQTELQKEDAVKVAEKAQHFTPFWGGYHASKAAQTVLNEEQAKQFSEPEVPSVIRSMSSKIVGRK